MDFSGTPSGELIWATSLPEESRAPAAIVEQSQPVLNSLREVVHGHRVVPRRAAILLSSVD